MGRENWNLNQFPTVKLLFGNAQVWIQYVCKISKDAQLKQIELNKSKKLGIT